MTEPDEPKVAVEKPDPAAAGRRPEREGAEHPGSSLGGAKDRSGTGGELPEEGPATDPVLGAGRATAGNTLTNGGSDRR